MIQVDDKIISLDIFEKYFICDLNSCKGACCIIGDSGAPITQEEEELLNNIYHKIKPYMSKKSIATIDCDGLSEYDLDGDLTTKLVDNKECVFVVEEDGIAKCAIEKAYLDGKISFKKPISCHLYPIRIEEYKDFDAINYEENKICNSACKYGEKLGIPVYTFLKEPLIRRYGEDWYNKLLEAASLLKE